MDMELKKEMIAINETVMRDNTQVLVQNDIIVPDVKSDMAKILQIDAEAMVDETVVSDKRADIAGKINLNILYVPEGDTKPVCSINSSIPFSTQIENARITVGSKCIVTADACHVEFSMLNSRKLSVKVVVELDTRCVRENSVELVCGIGDDGDVEVNRKEFEIYNLVCAENSKFSVKETLDFPAGKPSAVSVLKTDAKIAQKEVRIVTGKVVVKGMLDLCTLYVSTENQLEFMEHEIPFTEVIDAEGANESCICDAEFALCQTDFALRSDTDGDMRLLDVDLIIGVDLNLSQNTNMSAICDCFCADKKLICESKPFAVDILAGQGRAQEALRGSLSLPDDAPELLNVYNLIAKPYISEIAMEEGRANVRGVVDCYVLYLTASPVLPVNTGKLQIEFDMPIDIPQLSDNMDCDATIDVANMSYNITMTGEIEVRVTVSLEAKAIKKSELSLITNAYVDEDAPLDLRHGIVIYFVQPGDTLWKIAKKYQVPMALIRDVNRLEDENRLMVGQRLLIPSMKRQEKMA